MDVNEISSRPEATDDVPDSCQEPDRKGGDTAKVVIILTGHNSGGYVTEHGTGKGAAQRIHRGRVTRK
jgi:hypothetical protein